MSAANRLEENSWIEGVGNELVFAVFAFFGLIVPMLAVLFQRQLTQQPQHIHPESEDNVQAVRDEINHQRNSTEQSGQPTQRLLRENHGQHDCPVCLDTAHHAVQTNCGHIFCGGCIVTYWQHGSWLGAVKCPVCRQVVTILLLNFTQEEHNSATEAKRIIVDAIYMYNRRFSGEPRPWMDHLRDLPTLLRHMVREFFTVGGLIWMFRVRVIVCFIAALLYFISPFDIVPEAVFGILGYLDDIFIMLLLAIYVSLIYRQVVQNRANGAN